MVRQSQQLQQPRRCARLGSALCFSIQFLFSPPAASRIKETAAPPQAAFADERGLAGSLHVSAKVSFTRRPLLRASHCFASSTIVVADAICFVPVSIVGCDGCAGAC